MLISSRCLLGKEVREKMFGEVSMLFRELYSGTMHLTSVLFPYAPSPANRRRDRARSKLSKLLIDIVRSRKAAPNQVERDVLQILIDSKYKDGRSTTEAEVTGLIIMLLFGGNHTSSVTSTWTGACLLSHESSLAAAVEEQQKVWEPCRLQRPAGDEHPPLLHQGNTTDAPCATNKSSQGAQELHCTDQRRRRV